MVDFIDYSDPVIPRAGHSADRPAAPLSISEVWFDTDTDSLWKAKLTSGVGLSWVEFGGVESIGDEEISLDFTYTDTFPLSTYVFSLSGKITRCRLTIETAFDGTGGFTVGYAGFTDRLMEATDVAVSTVGAYEVPNNLTLPVTTDIQVYSNLVGSTQGDATILLNITR